MKKQITFLSFVFALCIIIFYSCSKSDSASPASGNNSVQLPGTWSFIDKPSGYKIYLTFNNDSTYTYSVNSLSNVYDSGRFSVSGNVVSFLTTLSSPRVCSQNQKGVYSFSQFYFDSINLKYISDSCLSRKHYFENKYGKM